MAGLAQLSMPRAVAPRRTAIASRAGAGRVAAVPTRARLAVRATMAPEPRSTQAGSMPGMVLGGIAAVASAALLAAPLPAAADIQYVPNDQITQQAKPLVLKQKVDKDKVWALFIGGAVVLFTTTIALENNTSLFPAIARANKAMAKVKKIADEAQPPQPPAAIDIDSDPVQDDDSRLLAATLEGLSEASAAASGGKAEEAPAAAGQDGTSVREASMDVLEQELQRRKAAESQPEPAETVTSDASLDALEQELAKRQQAGKQQSQ
mmetsp:Transcript_26162/g.66010  ORF Transcript_26162/g.66010 Transcript_26162/m.66010 type:complete len:265 (-) Transcript_26162:132-926(-)